MELIIKNRDDDGFKYKKGKIIIEGETILDVTILEDSLYDVEQLKLEYEKIKNDEDLQEDIVESDFYYVSCYYCEKRKVCPTGAWICEEFEYERRQPIDPPIQDTCGGENGWDLRPR
mgnify:CR=1 FL=1